MFFPLFFCSLSLCLSSARTPATKDTGHPDILDHNEAPFFGRGGGGGESATLA